MEENGFPSFQENLGSPIARRIEDWKSRLIDLSKRNNLLYFKPSKRGSLSVSSPNMITIFNRLALRKRRFEFWDHPEDPQLHKGKSQSIDFSVINGKSSPTSKQLVCEGTSRSELEKILKDLHNRSLLDYRERGVRILYANFGMLVWKEKETGEEVRSPLILVPIELDRKSFREPFTISVPPIEEEVVLNPALQVKLKKDFAVELPPLPEYWESQSLLKSQMNSDGGWKTPWKLGYSLSTNWLFIMTSTQTLTQSHSTR
jgi:hypothetical protein